MPVLIMTTKNIYRRQDISHLAKQRKAARADMF